MSTFETFLLAITAFIGTVMFFLNPLLKAEKWMRGKKVSQLKEEMDEKIDKDPGGAIGVGCGVTFFIFMQVLYTFIAEPFAVIAAVVNKIGYQPLAYAMLAVVALSWIVSVYRFSKRNTKTGVRGTVETDEGKKVDGKIVEVDKELELGNPVWNWVQRIFFFTPDLYLWYMFLVIIGVLK
jgi:hypothetical protein